MKFIYLLALLATPLASSLALAAFDARESYDAIPGVGLPVEFIIDGTRMVGTEILEKRSDRQVCQLVRPVVPNPEDRYRCFEETTVGEDAERAYRELTGAEASVIYLVDGQPRPGGKTFQKASGEGFCRKEGADQSPDYRFACYSLLN